MAELMLQSWMPQASRQLQTWGQQPSGGLQVQGLCGTAPCSFAGHWIWHAWPLVLRAHMGCLREHTVCQTHLYSHSCLVHQASFISIKQVFQIPVRSKEVSLALLCRHATNAWAPLTPILLPAGSITLDCTVLKHMECQLSFVQHSPGISSVSIAELSASAAAMSAAPESCS